MLLVYLIQIHGNEMTFYVIKANMSYLIINALLIFQVMAITGS